MLHRSFAALALLLLLGACATPTRVALSPQVRQQLQEAKANSFIWQDEAIVYAETTTTGGGGLVGALVKSKIAEGRQEKLQDVVEPFYSNVEDVDFRQQFWTALEAALKDNFAVKVVDLQKNAIITDRQAVNEAREKLATPDKAFINIGTSYAFNHDFSRLHILTGIDIYQGGNSTAVYSNVFTYQSGQVGSGGADSIDQWSANQGRRYRETINEGIGQIIKMLKLDIVAEATDPPQTPQVALRLSNGLLSQDISGPALDEQTNRVIARHSDGRLYSLPR